MQADASVKYLYEKGLTRKDTIRLETLSGIKILKLHLQDNKEVVESVTVDMLEPKLENPETIHRSFGARS